MTSGQLEKQHYLIDFISHSNVVAKTVLYDENSQPVPCQLGAAVPQEDAELSQRRLLFLVRLPQLLLGELRRERRRCQRQLLQGAGVGRRGRRGWSQRLFQEDRQEERLAVRGGGGRERQHLAARVVDKRELRTMATLVVRSPKTISIWISK